MRLKLSFLLLGAAFATTSLAHADTYTFSFTTNGMVYPGGGAHSAPVPFAENISASGILTESGGTISNITGTETLGGSTFNIIFNAVIPGTSDNLIASTSYPYLDTYGVSYYLTPVGSPMVVVYGTPEFYLFDSYYTDTAAVFTSVGRTNGLVQEDENGNDAPILPADINFTPGTTPEPSSFVLLGTGMLAAAGAARRRFLARNRQIRYVTIMNPCRVAGVFVSNAFPSLCDAPTF